MGNKQSSQHSIMSEPGQDTVMSNSGTLDRPRPVPHRRSASPPLKLISKRTRSPDILGRMSPDHRRTNSEAPCRPSTGRHTGCGTSPSPSQKVVRVVREPPPTSWKVMSISDAPEQMPRSTAGNVKRHLLPARR